MTCDLLIRSPLIDKLVIRFLRVKVRILSRRHARGLICMFASFVQAAKIGELHNYYESH